MDLDRKLFLTLAATLLGFGVLMVHSASITSRPSAAEAQFLSRHFAFAACGIVAAIVTGFLPARLWKTLSPWLFWGTVALLVGVLIPGVGSRLNGAQRWFRYGGLSLQPSEFAKISLPLYVCLLLARRIGSQEEALLPPRLLSQVALQRPLATLVLAFPCLVVVPLVIIQPDLGTALFLALGAAIALWVGGWPIWNFLLVGTAALPAVCLTIWHKPYQMQRIVGYLETWSDWTQAPYHLKQSLVTMGAGGVWGVGLGRGYQKLSFLPEANTDFVFAVIGEELGLLGTLAVLMLWLAFYVCGLRLINRLPASSFGYHVAFTLLTQIALQAAINVAVVTALVPPKGIPHPLLSYGGSNLVVTLIACGIVVSLTRDVHNVEIDRENSVPQARP